MDELRAGRRPAKQRAIFPRDRTPADVAARAVFDFDDERAGLRLTNARCERPELHDEIVQANASATAASASRTMT